MAYDTSKQEISLSGSVSVPDVQAALKTNENRVFQLGTHQNINMWSLFKPIRDTRPAIRLDQNGNYAVTQLDSVLVPALDGMQVRAQGCCGINIVQHNHPTELADLSLTQWDWMYIRPTGKYTIEGKTATQDKWTPVRLGDFRGYKHNAESPFETLTIPEVLPLDGNVVIDTVFKLSSNGTNGIGTMGTATANAPRSILISDLSTNGFALKDAKLGLVLIKDDGSGKITQATSYRMCTCDSVSGGKIHFPFKSFLATEFPNGAFAIAFLTNATSIADGLLLNTLWKYILHPGCDITKVRFGSASESTGLIITISTTKASRLWSYSIKISVSATGKAQTLSNGYMYLLLNGKRVVGPKIFLASKTFLPGESQDYYGTFNATDVAGVANADNITMWEMNVHSNVAGNIERKGSFRIQNNVESGLILPILP